MSDEMQNEGRVPVAPTWGKDLGWQGEPHEAQAITVDVGLVAPADAAPEEPSSADGYPCGTVTFGDDNGGQFDVGAGVHFHIGKRTP